MVQKKPPKFIGANLQKYRANLQADKHARTAGYRRLHQCTRTTYRGPTDRANSTRERLSASNGTTATHECGGTHRARIAADRQENRHRCGWRSLAGIAPDD